MTNLTMKERLARAALEAYYPQSLFNSDHPECEKFRRVVEAVLDELYEPSEGIVKVGTDKMPEYREFDESDEAYFVEWWQVILDHIRSEDKT